MESCPHRICEECEMCAGYVAECFNANTDDYGRVTRDGTGQYLHTECRRVLTLHDEKV